MRFFSIDIRKRLFLQPKRKTYNLSTHKLQMMSGYSRTRSAEPLQALEDRHAIVSEALQNTLRKLKNDFDNQPPVEPCFSWPLTICLTALVALPLMVLVVLCLSGKMSDYGDSSMCEIVLKWVALVSGCIVFLYGFLFGIRMWSYRSKLNAYVRLVQDRNDLMTEKEYLEEKMRVD